MTPQAERPLTRIAVCTAGELFGGVERHILGAADGLRLQGVDVCLVLFAEGELAAQARARGLEPIVLSRPNWRLRSTSRALAEILRQKSIRVVHAHGYKASVICALAGGGHRFALVKTEHGLPEPMSGRPLDVVRDRFYRLLDRWATRLAGASVCYVTEDLRRRHARAHAGLRTAVIVNGVPDMDRAACRRPPELRGDWFNLAIVGRVDTVKGHHVVLRSLGAAEMPRDAHLHVVGSGPEEAALRSLAADLHVADRVHFLGFRRDVFDFIAHCDVLLMPSLHEGLPYALLEGMALGASIVASGVGGLAEVITHGVDGALVPPADPGALAAAIRELRQHPELRAQRGAAARETQRARYSLAAMTRAYLEEYRAALAALGARPGA